MSDQQILTDRQAWLYEFGLRVLSRRAGGRDKAARPVGQAVAGRTYERRSKNGRLGSGPSPTPKGASLDPQRVSWRRTKEREGGVWLCCHGCVVPAPGSLLNCRATGPHGARSSERRSVVSGLATWARAGAQTDGSPLFGCARVLALHASDRGAHSRAEVGATLIAVSQCGRGIDGPLFLSCR
jgi:hypothetical protein